MVYLMSDPYIMTLVLSGAMFLAGLTVYGLFYHLLQKIFASGLGAKSAYKEEIVMCGLDYEYDEISAPISRVFVDIMKRSLPKLHYEVEEKIGTKILNDWFTWMLILLVTVVILIAMFGWY